jgi:hypothetical protein
MDQLNSYADNRLINGCIYCGGPEETRDHVPSRVFLDPPFPENLPVVWACGDCNGGFSLDEEYVACLIEAVVAGSADPARIRRAGVASILSRSPALRARLDAARTVEDGQTRFGIEPDRVRNVLLKLARGHAAYELSQPCRHEPTTVCWWPLGLMADEERDSFESGHIIQTLGEVGSRALQRVLVTQLVLRAPDGQTATVGLLVSDWVDVQDYRYRYQAIDDGGEVRVKIVIGEYLASEITWSGMAG